MDKNTVWLQFKALFQERKFIYRLIIIALIILGVGIYFFLSSFFAYSRDAFLYANVGNINAQVSGPITQLYIRKNNQYVKKGQELIDIDKRPYQYAYQQAQARLTQAKINYKNLAISINTLKDQLSRKQAAAALIADHLMRYQALYQQGDAPQIKVADLQYQQAEVLASLEKIKKEIIIAQQKYNKSGIYEAQAALNQAKYNLNHTIIYAPFSGYVTNFYARVGDHVRKGQGLFALVDNSEWWVITRYRETVLRHIKVGQKVTVWIDMYPGKKFHGEVESIGWGINRFQASSNVRESTLAYLEPTEYWIRIAQRFPVRIRITDLNQNIPLRVGANARTWVHTG
ncbi:MAG: secretion protein HlyD [Legionellales bacterium]|nr:secretion protein HlyD [Legionellales bacterium]|tara:strand:- start:974 stop:2002 length:1029 start_codon:yes stop_codon:yes gene_type:complete